MSKPTNHCPNCGDAGHLYKRGADLRWSAEEDAWIEDDSSDYELIECTSCDWQGNAGDLDYI